MKTVFHSWQADSSQKTNRNLIEKAIKQAIKSVNQTTTNTKSHYALDKDTLNKPGSPDIVETIIEKIHACEMLVADITPITKSASGKLMPNSNVLFEAGISVGIHGFERTILLANVAESKLEDLPFDIKTKRILKYSLSVDSEATKSTDVIKALTTAIGKSLELLDTLPPKAARSDSKMTDQTKRKRDLVKLKRFLENLPIRAIQGHVTMGHESLAMDFDVFTALYNLQGVQSFQGFRLYDETLQKKIDSLVSSLDFSLSFGLNFHYAHKTMYRFRETSKVKESDYLASLDRLNQDLGNFLSYVHKWYPEINLETYNKKAWKAYIEEITANS